MLSRSDLRRGLTPFFGIVAVCLLAAACGSTGSSDRSGMSSSAQPAALTGEGHASPLLGSNLDAVSCNALGRCVAVGGAFQSPATKGPTIVISSDAGTTWTAASGTTAAGASFDNVACSTSGCIVSGRKGSEPVTVRIIGRHGSLAATDQPPAGHLSTVACGPRVACLGLATDGAHGSSATTSDAGATWSSVGALPDTASSLTSLTCVSAQRCIAAGGGALVISTADGGATWNQAALPAGALRIDAVSCLGNRRCFGVAHTESSEQPVMLRSVDHGATFSVVASVPGLATPRSVACTTTTCVVVGSSAQGAGAAVRYRVGGPPQPIVLRFSPTALIGVSCGSPRSCVAVGGASLVRLAL